MYRHANLLTAVVGGGTIAKPHARRIGLACLQLGETIVAGTFRARHVRLLLGLVEALLQLRDPSSTGRATAAAAASGATSTATAATAAAAAVATRPGGRTAACRAVARAATRAARIVIPPAATRGCHHEHGAQRHRTSHPSFHCCGPLQVTGTRPAGRFAAEQRMSQRLDKCKCISRPEGTRHITISPRSRALAQVISWISSVPPPICSSLASRASCSTRYSRM